MRWGPRNAVLKNARLKRGMYLCAGCKEEVPASLPKEGRKGRDKNVFVDHIHPVIDPAEGFTTWDSVIERMYCEEAGMQLLCKKCHDDKTKEENNERRC